MATSNVTGLPQVLANLDKRKKDLAEGLNRGLRLAGLKVQRESQQVVPVNTGNLKASAFTRAEGEGWKTNVMVGYTAAYALFVHENVEMKLKGLPRPTTAAGTSQGSYWDPPGRGQAKFLEEPARRLGPELIAIIKKEMGIK